MSNKTTEVTEGHREGVFGIAEYVREEVAFVQANYARLLRAQQCNIQATRSYPASFIRGYEEKADKAI